LVDYEVTTMVHPYSKVSKPNSYREAIASRKRMGN